MNPQAPPPVAKALRELHSIGEEMIAYADLHKLPVVIVSITERGQFTVRGRADQRFFGNAMKAIDDCVPGARLFFDMAASKNRPSAWKRFLLWLPWNRKPQQAVVLYMHPPP